MAGGDAQVGEARRPADHGQVVPMGEARFRAGFPDWEPLDQLGLFHETERLLERLEIRGAISDPARAPLRPAWARGL